MWTPSHSSRTAWQKKMKRFDDPECASRRPFELRHCAAPAAVLAMERELMEAQRPVPKVQGQDKRIRTCNALSELARQRRALFSTDTVKSVEMELSAAIREKATLKRKLDAVEDERDHLKKIVQCKKGTDSLALARKRNRIAVAAHRQRMKDSARLSRDAEAEMNLVTKTMCSISHHKLRILRRGAARASGRRTSRGSGLSTEQAVFVALKNQSVVTMKNGLKLASNEVQKRDVEGCMKHPEDVLRQPLDLHLIELKCKCFSREFIDDEQRIINISLRGGCVRTL